MLNFISYVSVDRTGSRYDSRYDFLSSTMFVLRII